MKKIIGIRKSITKNGNPMATVSFTEEFSGGQGVQIYGSGAGSKTVIGDLANNFTKDVIGKNVFFSEVPTSNGGTWVQDVLIM